MIDQEQILNVTADGFIPTASAGTGTVTTSGTAFETSTANQYKVGDYMASTDNKEVRKVLFISRDGLYGKIESAFSSDLSAESVEIISKDDSKIIVLGVASDQGSDTTVNGATVTSGTSVNFAVAPINAARGNQFVRPAYIGGSTGGAATVTIQRFSNS